MKLADYVIGFFSDLGIKHNFLVSGGAVIHLVDATSKNRKIKCVCSQHEQLGAAAADGYARVAGLGLTMTTSGPGATNILTSVCNAFFDSIPLLCVTGQVSRFRLKNRPGLRQKGFQETDVISIFKSVTNYAVQVTDPLKIRYELEKAVYLATHNRPGPVVVDIPDDLQREEIDPAKLEPYIPLKRIKRSLKQPVQQLLQFIQHSKRPALLMGAGVRISKADKQAIAFARRFHIPIFFTWGGADILPSDDPLNMGVVGVCGPRGNNFGLQFSDLVISMGSRMSPMITGGKQTLFAPDAKKVMIDVDGDELKKFEPTSAFSLDLMIQADLKDFFEALPELREEEDRFIEWKALIHLWRKEYPICRDHTPNGDAVNPYLFAQYLSNLFGRGDIIVGDTGANLCALMQTIQVKEGQQIFSAWNHTPMGYSLPASIGAQLAAPERRVHCVIGDGGLMMCLQELATLRRWNLPIKIFLFNNKGHAIQKQTIDIWLNSNYVAVDEPSGLYFPDYEAIAKAFDIEYLCIKTETDFKKMDGLFDFKKPLLVDVQIMESHRIIPMLKFGGSIDDLHPKISPQEIEQARLAAAAIQSSSQMLGV